MNSRTQNIVLGVLIAGLVGLSVAYATLSTTLNITNSAKVQSMKWKVYFSRIDATATKVGTPTVTTEASITNETTIGGLDVTFTGIGQSVKYTFDVKNDGDFDAKLNEFTLGTPTCKYSDGTSAADVCSLVTFTVTPTPSAGTSGETLAAGATKTYTLEVSFDKSKSSTTLNISKDVTITGLTASYKYVQK